MPSALLCLYVVGHSPNKNLYGEEKFADNMFDVRNEFSCSQQLDCLQRSIKTLVFIESCGLAQISKTFCSQITAWSDPLWKTSVTMQRTDYIPNSAQSVYTAHCTGMVRTGSQVSLALCSVHARCTIRHSACVRVFVCV